MARLRDDPAKSLSLDTRTVTATAAALFLSFGGLTKPGSRDVQMSVSTSTV
jgi:hypothetical protein